MYSKHDISTDNRDLTLKEWPRKADSIAVFDNAYQPIILKWLCGRSLKDVTGIHIPAQSLIKGSYASAVLCDGCSFLVLVRTENGIEEHLFTSDSVISIRRHEILLNGQLRFSYMHDQKLNAVSVQYNTSQSSIIEPLLSAALGNSLQFDLHQASLTYPRPEKLFNDNYALYNYAADGAQFKAMHSYRILALRERKSFFRHNEPGAVLIAQFDEGILAIVFRAEKQDVIEYFFKNDCVEEDSRKSEIRFIHKPTSEILLEIRVA